MKNCGFNGNESPLYRFEALCVQICQTKHQEGLYQLYKKIGLLFCNAVLELCSLAVAKSCLMADERCNPAVLPGKGSVP